MQWYYVIMWERGLLNKEQGELHHLSLQPHTQGLRQMGCGPCLWGQCSGKFQTSWPPLACHQCLACMVVNERRITVVKLQMPLARFNGGEVRRGSISFNLSDRNISHFRRYVNREKIVHIIIGHVRKFNAS